MSEVQDANVRPGRTVTGGFAAATRVRVLRLPTGAPTVDINTPSCTTIVLAPPTTNESVWLSILCDDGAGNGVPFYIIWAHGALALQDPDPLANATDALNLNRQCIRVPADFEYMRKLQRGDRFRAIQLSGADAFLRMELISPNADNP